MMMMSISVHMASRYCSTSSLFPAHDISVCLVHMTASSLANERPVCVPADDCNSTRK